MMIEIKQNDVNEYHARTILSNSKLIARFRESNLLPANDSIECTVEYWTDDGHGIYERTRSDENHKKAFNQAAQALCCALDREKEKLQELIDGLNNNDSFNCDYDDDADENSIMPDDNVPHEYDLKNDYRLIVTYHLDEHDKNLPVLCKVKLMVFNHTLIDDHHWDKTKRAALVNLILDRLQKQYPTYKTQLIDGFTCAFADLTKAEDYYSQWY